MCHRANAHVTSPVGIIYRRAFSVVWRDQSHRPVKICPLDRVVTHKNLIYLLKLQIGNHELQVLSKGQISIGASQ